MTMKKLDFSDSITCTLIGLIINLALTVFKLLAGIFGMSYAMIADGLHSASDTVATCTAYLGIKMGNKPADEEHPYGHANAETISALIVALLILGTGILIGGAAIHLILEQDIEEPGNIAIAAAAISIVIKEIMYRYTINVGKRNNSPAVIASAWDHRTDAYSSVAALIGIAGSKMAFVYLDPLASIVIAVMIVFISFKLLRSNVGILMYERPEREFLETIRKTACIVEGVRDIHDIRVHRCGPHFNVDLKIAVDKEITVGQGHTVAGKVRSELLQRVEHVVDVMIHVNPYHDND